MRPTGTSGAVLLPIAESSPLSVRRTDRNGGLGGLFTRPSARWLLRAALVSALLLTGATAAAPQTATVSRESVVAVLIKWTPLMAQGFALNLAISFLAMAIGTVAGIGLGLARISLLAPVRAGAWLTTQFFRNAPWLALLFFCVYALPHIVSVAGVRFVIPDWTKATLGLALPVMANVAEIVRGAIQGIPTTQWQAASALGLNRRMSLRLVILPQCIKPAIPPWMNWYAILAMATPLASIVGVVEAMQVTSEALVAEGRFELLIPMYLYLLTWFFIYCYPIARWTEHLEKKYGVIQ
jgi:polar amino acid transport system permease protein